MGLAVRAPGSARRIAKTRTQPPGPPPLGHHVVPATRLELAFRAAGQGELKDGRWVHERLGLSMAWPDGSVLIDNPASALTAASRDGAMIFATYLDEPRSPRGDDGFLNAALASFFKAAGIGPKDVSLGLRHVWTNVEVDGVASAETSATFDGGIEVHARTTSMCHGKGAFHVLGIMIRPESRGTVDRWLGSLKGPADPLLCAEP